MLTFFPKLYPDELLYSALARYHIRSGNKSFRQTDLDLFKYHSQQLCKVALPSNLGYLVKNLRLFSNYKIENIIQNHTLYPFYATFLTPQEAWLLKDSMKRKVNGSIFEIAKESTNSINNLEKFLKFCLKCLAEDTQQYGEAYWHRIHQTPGVFVCPAHGVALQDSTVPLVTKGIQYEAPNIEKCLIATNKRTYANETLHKLLLFAKDIEGIINTALPFKNMTWLRDRYKFHLVEQNFMTVLSKEKFIFHEQEFFSAFLDFCSQEFLVAVNPKLIEKPEKYLANCLLACDLNPVIDRIAHLLIIRFLVNSINNFFRAAI